MCPMTLFKHTTVDDRRMNSHGERIGDGGRREPWAFCRFNLPTLPADSAVGVSGWLFAEPLKADGS